MSAIKTYSGVMFDPLNINSDLITITDIAHALSLMCRANGHFKTFYSVGQHCINCANEAQARGESVRVQLGCLLHDGSEAYIADITRPVKKALPEYLKIEEPLQQAIWDKWICEPLTHSEVTKIFEIDDVVLMNEFYVLMDTALCNPIPNLKSAAEYTFSSFEETEKVYIAKFHKLLAEL